MKHAIITEIKSCVCNFRFLVGVVLIIAVALVSDGSMLQKLASSDTSPEGPGWYVAYSYCMNSINALLFIPIAVTFAGGENAEEELRTRFSLLSYIRTGKKQYLAGKAMGLIVSGALMVFFAMTIMLLISIIGFAHIPAMTPEYTDVSYIVSKTILSFPRLCLNGALWALTGGLAAVVTKNRYMAYAVPFILYYVLTVFQERYYQSLFFLSPRYWAASIYYGDFFCITVLFAGSLLMAFLFMWAIKRRLDHA